MSQNQTGMPAGATQQAVMSEPPQVITNKDLSYLQDVLSWELLSMKKCAHYAQECTDPDIQQQLNQAGQMHLKHYEMLLRHLGSNNTQAMSQTPQPTQAH